MVSAVDRAKRALVALLRYLATAYGCVVDVTRDSDDAAVRRAYRLVSRRVHPDRGGNEEDQKKLNGAHDEWCQAQRDKGPRGRPAPGADRPEPRNDPQATAPSGLAAQAGGPLPRAAFRIEGQAVLLTYQGITWGVLQWERFVAFVRSHLKPWRVQYWTANLGNEQGRLFFSLPPSYKPKEEFAPVCWGATSRGPILPTTFDLGVGR